jgi:hypothetical protein
MGDKALGVMKSIDSVADAATYAAPTPAQGVTVTSVAATDLDDAAAQIVILTTTVNAILTALREHALMDS